MTRSIFTALGIGLVFLAKIFFGVFHVAFTSIYQSIRTVYDELRRDLRQLQSRQDNYF